jgi:magnesium transporter
MTIEELRKAMEGDRDAILRLSNSLRDREPIEGLDSLLPHESAQLVLRLRPKRAHRLLRRLGDAPSLSLLSELDPKVAERLLDPEQQARIVKIVSRLEIDAAADFLSEAPEAVTEAVLEAAPQPEALREALRHRAESAGAVMRRRLVAAPVEWTVGETISEIRARAELIDKVYAVYVIDDARRLLGHLKIRDLLLAPDDSPVRSIMRPDTIAVMADVDREEVARLAERNHLPVLPVIDVDRRLLGIVTPQELRQIERAEAEEDMKLMAGLAPKASAFDGPFNIVAHRLPWLAGGLVGAGIAAMVVGTRCSRRIDCGSGDPWPFHNYRD